MKTLRNTILSLILFTAFPLSVGASRLYMLPTRLEVRVGEPFSVELRLDTQGEDINALDIRVEIPDENLKLDSSSDKSSLINIWLEKPQNKEVQKCFASQKPCKAVEMAGIAPGGFLGNGLVAELRFIAAQKGQYSLDFSGNSVVLLNRQDATPAFVVSNGAKVVVKENNDKGGPRELDQFVSADNVPPEQFQPQLGRDENAFGNKWFLSFSTQDKDSGVSYYEVRESFLGFLAGAWVRTESPYLLNSQSLLSAISVRAVDQKGLARESLVVPTQLKIFYGVTFGLIFAILVLVGARSIIKRLPPHHV